MMRKTFVILKNGVMEIHDNNCLLEEFLDNEKIE